MKWKALISRGLIGGWGVIVLGLLVSCTPAGGAAEAAPVDYTLILSDPFTNTAVRLDPLTLTGSGDAPLADLWSTDGRTGISVVAEAGRANPDPEKTWIVIHDLAGGAERARFHPPVAGIISGLSADGRRLLWQPFPLPVGVYPPPVDWYVLDTAGGTVVSHVVDKDSACFRQSALLAPDGRRLYCLVDPALNEISGSQLIRIATYDVTKPTNPTAPVGNPAAEVILETRIGQQPNANQTGWELLEPALALSPDGATLAVVHADADRLTLLDAANLSITQSLDLHSPVSNLLDLLGLSARPAHAKGETSGTLRHAVFSADGRRLYVYSQVLTLPDEPPPAERGLWLVDPARGRVAAAALGDYQIQWVVPAPDGSIFVYGTADDSLFAHEIRETSPSLLWRLDGTTLDVLAKREFTGYRGGRTAVGPP